MLEARRVTGVLLSIAVVACGPSDTHRNGEASAAIDAAAARMPLLARVDHVFATSPKAEAHFNFFRDTLGLAVAWAYKSYGGFASGGLSVGNTVLEFVSWAVAEGETLPTEWKSVAFEPVGDTEAAVTELVKRGISHSTPDVNRYADTNGKEAVGWTNTDLTGLSPSGVVFICDYADRKGIHEVHKAARDELMQRHGGPLGVIELEEIVIGVTDLMVTSEQWHRLLEGTGQESNGLFTFGDGPGIRLVQAEQAGIQEVVIAVRSVEKARRFLVDRGLLELGDGRRVSIARSAIGGLHVTLVNH
jgi:catechol 2,3-dioxygenase-like lactoylglutathione lyase family enzyme